MKHSKPEGRETLNLKKKKKKKRICKLVQIDEERTLTTQKRKCNGCVRKKINFRLKLKKK